MMCQEHRASLVALAAGELQGLAAERLQAHLEHCEGCRALSSELAAGLSAARAYSPEPSTEHLGRLAMRLSPYLDAAETGARRRSWRWRLTLTTAMATATVALALAGLWVVRPAMPTAVPARARDVAAEPLAALAPAPIPTSAAASTAAVPVRAGAPRRQSPAPFLRLVASADWDGGVTRHGDALEVTMSRGLAAFSLRGGQGRRLQVRTPGGVVRVVGTRFAVEAEGERLVVRVAEGKVAVSAGAASTLLAAGEARLFAGGQVLVAEPCALATAYLSEPYLRSQNHAERFAFETGAGALSLSDDDLEADSVLSQMAEAESLSAAGHYDEALAIYRRCAGREHAYVSLCRFETGRLLGFALGDQVGARAIFASLAKEQGSEVGRQAALALCELERSSSPCLAAACLRRILDDGSASDELQLEAKRLSTRWHLPATCESGEKGDILHYERKK
jgi:hypothetical protein